MLGMVEARDKATLPCPEENAAETSGENRNEDSPETPDLAGYDLVWLPVVSIPSRDVITERIYVGKATLKEMFFDD